MIVVAGLGPAGPDLIPDSTWSWIGRAPEIFLRTERHPAVAGLRDREFQSFDYIYDREDSFDTVYQEMVKALLERVGKVSPVLFLVPGSPGVAEESVRLLQRECRSRGVELRIEMAPSFLDLVYQTLGIDPTDGLQVIDAYRLGDGLSPSPELGLVLCQVHSRLVAGDVKLRLLDIYQPDHPVTVLAHLGGDEMVRDVPLSELDHHDFDHLTSLYIPPEPPGGGTVGAMSRRFYRIISTLLGEDGCPWDRRQTHRSLRPYLLEECYEALEAIDSGDMEDLAGELGDVLLQVFLHSGLAEARGDFTARDVIEGIADKMVRRHPHVFSSVIVDGTEDVLANWETIKREESGSEPRSLVTGIPVDLPALVQATKVQERASRLGFDWPDASGPRQKVEEEISELDRAASSERREEEMGDVLFSVVNWARFMGISPEMALRGAVKRFSHRFQAMEQSAAISGKDLGTMSLLEMDHLWNEAKENE